MSRTLNTDLNDRLLYMALALISDHGFDGFNIDHLAAGCHTSKQAIYRRWPSKEAIAAAAVHRALEKTNSSPPDTGDLQEDLAAVLAATFKAWQTTPLGGALQALAGVRGNPELRRCLRLADDSRRNLLRALLRRSPAIPDIEMTIDHLLGAAFLRFLLDGKIPKGYERRMLGL